MCTYCMIGDHFFRHDPPWKAWPSQPLIPAPINPMAPVVPWPLDRLRELEDLLRRVKDLEDRLGCPCEPNKADYLALFRERIEKLEAEADKADKVEAERREPDPHGW